MKKHLILTSLLAIVATTGAARAATDVTFAGDYLLGDSTTANVGTPLNGSSYTYSYTKSDGGDVTVAQNVDPVLSYFTYTDKNGDPADLSTGGTELTAEDFDGPTVADGVNVISNQTIAANETISRDNYQYINGKGDTVTLGETAQSFTETVTLDSTYATVETVDVTSDSAAPVLTGDMYSYTDPDTGAVYHLNATGDQWVDIYNNVQTPDAGTPQEAARDAMVLAFAADKAAVEGAKTTVDGYATAEADAFAAADGVYTTDAGTISTLTTNYGTYTTATGLLGQAQTAQTARQGDFAADQALETAAKTLYNTPIETVQTNTLNSAKDYADTGDAATLADAQEYADTGDAATLADAKDYADAGDADIKNNQLGEINGLAASLDTTQHRVAENLSGAENATVSDHLTKLATVAADTKEAIASEVARATAQENAIRGEFAAADAVTLQSAKTYTDKKVDTLEKNVSGGVAAATALSAVSVSNVGKGEVSVGGGYGYYNSQSAVAFGAAMGLSDKWSVNAGAGIATGDKTQVSFRAGTNYKFKLF